MSTELTISNKEDVVERLAIEYELEKPIPRWDEVGQVAIKGYFESGQYRQIFSSILIQNAPGVPGGADQTTPSVEDAMSEIVSEYGFGGIPDGIVGPVFYDGIYHTNGISIWQQEKLEEA